jgi:hypothetical protein
LGKYSDSNLKDDHAAKIIDGEEVISRAEHERRKAKRLADYTKELISKGATTRDTTGTRPKKEKSLWQKTKEAIGETIEKGRRAVDYDEEDRTKAKERWK